MVSHPLVAVEILFRLGPLPLADWFFHFGAMVFGSAIAAEPVPRHGQRYPSWHCPSTGSCASSGRAWQLWLARHSQEEAVPLDAPPLPRVLEPAASIVAQFSAADHNPNSDPNPNHAGVPEDLLRLSTGCEVFLPLPLTL